MAIKRKDTDTQTEETQSQAQNEAQAPQVVETSPDAVEAQNGSNGSNGSKGKKGSTAPRITEGLFSDPATAGDRDKALISVLKASKGPGQIRTSSSVAHSLSQDKTLFPDGVLPGDVTYRVRAYRNKLKAGGQEPPAWLSLDSPKEVSTVDVGLLEA